MLQTAEKKQLPYLLFHANTVLHFANEPEIFYDFLFICAFGVSSLWD